MAIKERMKLRGTNERRTETFMKPFANQTAESPMTGCQVGFAKQQVYRKVNEGIRKPVSQTPANPDLRILFTAYVQIPVRSVRSHILL